MLCKITRTVAAALSIGALGGCGGGTGGASTPSATSPAGSPTLSPQKMLPVSVSLFVPRAKASKTSNVAFASGKLRPLYLPTSVNSVTMQQTLAGGSVVTGAPVTLLIIGGSNCVASAGGQTCTVTLQGPLGQDAWAFKSYVTGDGTGPSISLNTGTITVVTGAANVLTLTLNPILATLAFAPLAYSANATTTSTLPLVLLAKDTAGATIIGPGTYVTAANVATPITLSSSSAGHMVLPNERRRRRDGDVDHDRDQ